MGRIRSGLALRIGFNALKKNNRPLVSARLLIRQGEVGLGGYVAGLQLHRRFQFFNGLRKFSETRQDRAQGAVALLDLRQQAHHFLKLCLCGLEVVIRGRRGTRLKGRLRLVVDVGL